MNISVKLIIVCCLTFWASSAVSGEKVAVLDFKSIMAPEDLGVAVAEILRTELVGIGDYTVIERGMLRPGEELFSIGNRHKAKVRADGSLIGNDVKGSIHQVGAALEGAPSCNGWTYWHFKRDGKMVPIDLLRQQIRAEMEADQGRPH